MKKLRMFSKKYSAKIQIGLLYSVFIVVAGIGIYYFVNVKNNYDKYVTNNLALKLGARGQINCFGATKTNMDNMTWITSDPDIVDVDSSGFLVTKSNGKAEITQVTNKGEMSICKVEVRENINGNGFVEKLNTVNSKNKTVIKKNKKDTQINTSEIDEDLDLDLEDIDQDVVIKNNNDDSINYIISDEDILDEEDVEDFDVEDEDIDTNISKVEDPDVGDLTVDENDDIIIDEEDDIIIDDDAELEDTTDEDTKVEDVFTPEDSIKAQSVSLNQSNLNLLINGTFQLNTAINPTNATDKTVSYSSSNPGVVSITSSGLVKGLKEGASVITVTHSKTGLNAKCNVTVSNNKNTLNKIVFTNPKTVLNVGEAYTLSVRGDPVNAVIPNLTWVSSNSSIASVSNGVIKANSAGKTIITATSGKLNTSLNIEVKKVYPTSVKFNQSIINLPINSTYKVGYYLNSSKEADAKVSERGVTITSSNPKVVQILSGNQIKCLTTGSAKLTITTSNGKKDTCTIQVSEVKPSKVTLSKTALTLNLGSSATVSASIAPVTATNKTLKWTSSNTKVATVSNGNIKAVGTGSTTITVSTANNIKATIKVTVNSKLITVSSMSLSASGSKIINSKRRVIIKNGKSLKAATSVKPSNASNKVVTWKSSNTKVATVDSNGSIKAVSNGKATITAKSSNSKVYQKLYVTVVPNKSNIAINKLSFDAYTKNFKTTRNGSSSVLHMQNFDYEDGNWYVSGNPSGANVDIVKIPKGGFYKNSGRKYFTITGSGHGQSFDYEDGYIWTTGDPYDAHMGKKLIRIKFQSGKKVSWSKASLKLSLYNSSNKLVTNPEISSDKANNMVSTRYGRTVIIWDRNKLLKLGSKATKDAILYSFNLPSAADDQKVLKNYYPGTYIYKQGTAIKDGYLYVVYGATGGGTVLRVYNMNGELVSTKATTKRLGEAEGVKIIGGKVYVGEVLWSGSTKYNRLYKIG